MLNIQKIRTHLYDDFLNATICSNVRCSCIRPNLEPEMKLVRQELDDVTMMQLGLLVDAKVLLHAPRQDCYRRPEQYIGS